MATAGLVRKAFAEAQAYQKKQAEKAGARSPKLDARDHCRVTLSNDGSGGALATLA